MRLDEPLDQNLTANKESDGTHENRVPFDGMDNFNRKKSAMYSV